MLNAKKIQNVFQHFKIAKRNAEQKHHVGNSVFHQKEVQQQSMLPNVPAKIIVYNKKKFKKSHQLP
jgi:hypothetical protein